MQDIPNDWTFKTSGVADQFDRHVREQLPWYELATGLTAHVVRHYLPENGLIYDIGASTGNIEKSLDSIIEKRKARFVPIDNSEAMAEKYKGKSQLVITDAVQYDYEPFDVAILFLVLQFMSISDRKKLLQDLMSKVKPGGAIIVFDKLLVEGGYFATVMRRATMAGKLSSGTPAEEIVAKELSIGGVQRPLPERYFDFVIPHAKEIFRFGEFAGFLIERHE
jgi:tRNA (cmo5U34)-methyltransferase